jgi:hypothetical protein
LASDSCLIHGYVDRRDGWPLVMSIVREAVSVTGVRAGESRYFTRLTPLQGFVPPFNACAS